MNSIQEILAALGKGELNQEEANALLNGLVAEAAKPKQKGVYFEVSDKGAVKIKGMRAKWPIVLYPNEIQTILGLSDKLIDFIEANRAKLSFHKGDLAEKQGGSDEGELGQSEAA